MIKGDYDELTRLTGNHVCSEHTTPVVVAWHSGERCWTLRCGEGHYPDMITRQLSLTQSYKAGEEIPEPIKSNIVKAIRRREMAQGKNFVAEVLPGVSRSDLGTGEVLAPELIKALVNYASKYALDPVRGHVVLMYGKPYITIDGYLYHAFKSGKRYDLRSRPLDEGERKAMQLTEGDHGWKAEISLLPELGFFIGIGIVTKEEMTKESKGKPGQLASPVVAAYPWQLAQKRAEWQALRRAFPIGETKEQIGEAGD